MRAPHVVVEGPTVALADARADLVAIGWEVVDELPTGSAGTVWAIEIDDDATAATAVLAAVKGHGLLVDARADRPTIDRLCDDLRRLGHLDHRIGAPVALLSAEERALLDLLSEGISLGAAAGRLHLARRSADRRLASARAALGVATTAEAVATHRRRLARLPRPAPQA